MKQRRIRTIAWGLSGIAIAGGLFQMILWLRSLSGRPTLFDLVEAVGWGLAMPLLFSVLAALIVARQPGNRVGWLMMIVALGLNNPAEVIASQMAGPPATMTIDLWLLLWLDGWSWIPVIFPIFLIPLYFPTGMPSSPRWTWVNRLAIGLWVLFMVLSAFIMEAGPINADWTVPNPIGFIPDDSFAGPFLILWGIALLTTVSASVISLFMRYRRAAGTERQQIKWLLFAGAVFALVYGITFFSSDSGEVVDSGLSNLIFVLTILGMPVAIAIAIFRYRLWDLDVVVNRTLVYGPLTTIMAGTFAMVIAITTEVTKQTLGAESKALGAAISAVIVAVVFQPLRDWIEKGVDKRFYPQKLDLASGLVEVQPEYWTFLDQEVLMEMALEHVARVLDISHVAFYLGTKMGNFQIAQQLGVLARELQTVSLSEKQCTDLNKKRVVASELPGIIIGHVPIHVDRGKSIELLGLLAIGSRTNGKGYSGDDLKGLVELGGKIGLALRAIQLGGNIERTSVVGTESNLVAY